MWRDVHWGTGTCIFMLFVDYKVHGTREQIRPHSDVQKSLFLSLLVEMSCTLWIYVGQFTDNSRIWSWCPCIIFHCHGNEIRNKVCWRHLLPRHTMRKRGLCCRPGSVRPSVCLSIRPSVAFMYCIQTAKNIVKVLSRPGSFVWPRAPVPISKGNPFSGGSKYMGWKNLRFSTEIAVYHGNSTK